MGRMHFIGVSATIIKETEKAYQVEVLYWTKANQPTKKAKMWTPKSCSKTQDGKVIEIAEFILNQWEKEHREFIGQHSGYAASKIKINWDMNHKEALIKREAEESAAYKKQIDDAIAKYLPLATESSHKFLSILGLFAKGYGRFWKENGVDAATCDEFISWGKEVCKKYGQPISDVEYYERIKNYDEKERRLSVEYAWQNGVLGEFAYENGEKYITDVNTNLLKKFKKESALREEYQAFAEKLYQLNGNKF